jgi:hypothetical protein
MKSNGPLILAVLFLSAGLSVIFRYGVSTAGFNFAYPLSGANLQLSIATAGPAAVGGLALVAFGLLLMFWALVCAIVGVFQPSVSYVDRPQKLQREELKRMEREERLMQRQERLRAAYPKD